MHNRFQESAEWNEPDHHFRHHARRIRRHLRKAWQHYSEWENTAGSRGFNRRGFPMQRGEEGRSFQGQGRGSRGGDWGPFRGPRGRGGRGGGGGGGGEHFFGRGDLKFALLSLLEERPMHGYEMIKELRERTGGRYQASAGSVYPTLQMLADRELVTVEDQDGKKTYQLSDAGRAFIQERGPSQADHPGWREFRGHGGRGMQRGRMVRQKMHEIGATLRELRHTARNDENVVTSVNDILDRTLSDLRSLLTKRDDQF